MFQDLSFAVRALLRRPTLVVVAVATLAIGIGANAAIFSLVHGVLLQPLPYRDPGRLALLWHEFGEGAQFLPALHPLDYRDYRDRSRLFEDFTIATGAERILGGASDPELVEVGDVAANFFPFLGIDPARGRHLAEGEDAVGAAPVVLLSHELWTRRFGADPGVLGRTVDLDGTPHEVIGILPEGFRLVLPAEAFRLKHAEAWRPVQIPWDRLPPRNYTGFTVFGRLKPGVTFAAAQEEMAGLAAQLRREHAEHAASNLRVSVVPLQHDIVKGARRALLLLMAAVGFVLLIACANVAQLLMTRGRERERELLVRAAVGASRLRIARLVVAEALVLATAGATLAVPLALGGLALVRRLAADAVPRLHAVTLDLSVLAFMVAAALLAALVFGTLPALQASRPDLAEGMKEGAVRSASPRQGRVRHALVVGQLALSLVLVVGAGLMIQSFAALARVRPGFVPEGALTARVSLPPQAYPDAAAARAMFDELRLRLRSAPGVTDVAAVSMLPLAGSGPLQPYAYDERTRRNWESVSADHRWVSPGFFDAVGATLVAGRDFTASDFEDGRRRIVIDDTLAARAFAGQDPVGQHLQVEPDGTDEPYAEVIGVVGHLRLHDLARAMLPQIYSPRVSPRFSVVVRTSADPAALAGTVRRELRSIAPGAAIEDVRTLDDIVAGGLGPTRLAVSLMSAFGAVAILLAAVGIYGVFSYAVAQRRREIAIRMALGDAPSGIRRLVLGEGARVVGASLVLGVLGAAALSRFVALLLYGIDPLDPPTYFAATVFLAAVSLLACWVPAERAARVAPIRALRND